MQEFKLTYMTSKTLVTIENGMLYAKIGPFVKKEIDLNSIQYFYINETKDYKEFIIRYTKSNGKDTNVRFICDFGIEDIDNLGNAISSKFSLKDLRKLDAKEAMKLMKAANTQKIALFIILLIIPVFMSIFVLPDLIHYFDKGHENAKIEDVIEGKEFSTRNLTLEGIILNEGMWSKTTTRYKGSTTTSEGNFFPLIPETWEKGDPIYVMVSAGDLQSFELDELVSKTSFNGVIRDVLWESGIDSDMEDFFQKEYGITFDKNIKFFELNNGNSYSYIFLFLGLVIIIDIFLFVFMWIRYNKKSK